MTWQNSPAQNGLNWRHLHLPIELQQVILASVPVSYEIYERYKDIYSSTRLQVKFNCIACGKSHTSNFKHLNKRTKIKDALCPACVMGVVTKDKEWLFSNSQAQLKIQSTLEQKAKNAAGVSKFWADNPEKLESMKITLMAAQQRPEVKEKFRMRKAWNGRGISGDYLSKWGWLSFDSSYELALLAALEARGDIASVRRGPIIEYVHKNVKRDYFMDYEIHFLNGEKWWCEVKSGYIGKQRDRIDKLRCKLASALEQARLGNVDRVIMVTETTSMGLFQFKIPRGGHCTTLFRKLYSKIIFADSEHEERFK